MLPRTDHGTGATPDWSAEPLLAAEGRDLTLARSGDAAALGRLFDRHFDRVYAISRRILGRTDLAQDIAQEVFLKVRRNLPQLRADIDIGPWIHAVTVNACRDHLRSGWWRLTRRSTPIEAMHDLPAPLGHGVDPERALIQFEEQRQVQAALMRLPEDQRVSIVLHDFEGLSHEAIAQLTRTTQAAARKRHSRAMRVLTILLEGSNPHE